MVTSHFSKTSENDVKKDLSDDSFLVQTVVGGNWVILSASTSYTRWNFVGRRTKGNQSRGTPRTASAFRSAAQDTKSHAFCSGQQMLDGLLFDVHRTYQQPE